MPTLSPAISRSLRFVQNVAGNSRCLLLADMEGSLAQQHMISNPDAVPGLTCRGLPPESGVNSAILSAGAPVLVWAAPSGGCSPMLYSEPCPKVPLATSGPVVAVQLGDHAIH